MRYVYFIFLFLCQQVYAFRLDPMVVTMNAKNGLGSATYSVDNNSAQKIAVQFSVAKREVDEKGNESRPAATGFSVFPEQVSLEPGEKRVIRVSWQGDTNLQQEQAYRFIATQLPVTFDKIEKNKKASLNFLLEYVASLYVTSEKFYGEVKIIERSFKNNILVLKVQNNGTAHQLFEKAKFTFTDESGKQIKPSDESMKDLRAENILAKSTRIISVKLNSKSKNVNARIEF